MSNPELAALIARSLGQGLKHPGDVDNNISPSVLKLPGFNTTAMRPDQAEEFLGSLGKLFGEAIIHLIEGEGDCEIIPKVQTKAWREHTAELEKDRDDALSAMIAAGVL